MSRILVKFPTRERPQQFRRVLMEWVNMADDNSRIHWLFSFDKNDPSAKDAQEFVIAAMGMTGKSAETWIGTSEGKIHAVNRDVEKVTKPWDILLVLSDDMVCARKGWDTVIRAQMEHYAPDGDGLLWFYDGGQPDIVTLPIMGRTYFSRTGYVYHPGYKSVWADNEQTDVARALGKLFYFATPIARHDHPAWNGKTPDALYRKNETPAAWKLDEALYWKRKAQGFP